MVPFDDDSLRERLTRALERRPEVLEAYLCAARARKGGRSRTATWTWRCTRRPSPPSPFGYEAEIAAELMSAIGESRLDLVLLDRAPPLLYHRVLRDGVRLFSRDPRATTAREGAALSRYCDHVSQLAKVDGAIRARIERAEFGR